MWTAPGRAAWNSWSTSMTPSFLAWNCSGSLTAVDARITADSAFAAAVNKFIPQVPKLRANAMATYRIDAWAFTLGARYSDRSFGTIDNSDPVFPHLSGIWPVTWWSMRVCATGSMRTGTCPWASTISTMTNISCFTPFRSALS